MFRCFALLLGIPYPEWRSAYTRPSLAGIVGVLIAGWSCTRFGRETFANREDFIERDTVFCDQRLNFSAQLSDMWNRNAGADAADATRDSSNRSGDVLAEQGDHKPVTFESPENERRAALTNMEPLKIERLPAGDRARDQAKTSFNEQKAQARERRRVA